ncbi:CoA-binding protein [Halobellus sp. GM3]|uniref:CoA-binding protein n=1 Tax=Halobellus sp. GM3 TaxID=3458410 RepID=UPI00403DF8A3
MALNALFSPETVAVIGASKSPEKIGHEVLANLGGFDGDVFPVNPNSDGELFGRPFHESVTDVPKQVDLALLCLPAPVTPDVMEDCGTAGVGAAVIYGGGFAEAGEEGESLQRAVTEIADERGISILGPNTSGFLVPRSGLYTHFVDGTDRVEHGNVAVVAQSGGVGTALAFQAVSEGRGLSAMVGLGNRANVGFNSVIEYFDADEETDAIVLHLEGTDDARGLLEVCEAADTPVAVYKVGQEDVNDFAASHTGALTGDHELYVGGFRQHGIATASSTTRLLDVGVTLAKAGPIDGPNVGVVTAQAGPGIIAADRLKAAGAELPSFDDATSESIDAILPGITFSGNPVDTGRPMPEFSDVVAHVASDDAIDVVLVYQVYEPAVGFHADALSSLPEETGTPVLFATNGPEDEIREDLSELESVGIPAFPSVERGADAAAAAIEYAARQRVVGEGNDR